MTKSDIHTIRMQEEKIKSLDRELKASKRAFDDLWKRNEKLTNEVRRLLGRCNELDGVNT
jgi:hypothetical protein